MNQQAERYPQLRYFARLMYDSDSEAEAVASYMESSGFEDPQGELLRSDIVALLDEHRSAESLARAITEYGEYSDRAQQAIIRNGRDYRPYLEAALALIKASRGA